MLGGLYDISKCALGCANVEVGQDFATVHSSTLEDYEKGILLMSNAV